MRLYPSCRLRSVFALFVVPHRRPEVMHTCMLCCDSIAFASDLHRAPDLLHHSRSCTVNFYGDWSSRPSTADRNRAGRVNRCTKHSKTADVPWLLSLPCLFALSTLQVSCMSVCLGRHVSDMEDCAGRIRRLSPHIVVSLNIVVF